MSFTTVEVNRLGVKLGCGSVTIQMETTEQYFTVFVYTAP